MQRRPMNKREKRFWKKQLQCSPEDFKAEIGNRLSLNHWSIEINDEVISWLAPVLDEVEELNLTDTNITEQGVAHLSSLNKLQYLRLKDTFLDKTCIPHLLHLHSLEHLHLGIFEGTCADLIPLGQLSNLQELIAKPQDEDQDALKEIFDRKPDLKLVINSQQVLF